MAIRLGEYVIEGELHNTNHYAAHGAILLRSEAPEGETVVHLQLTGDCAKDLRGKCIRFRPENPDEAGPRFNPEESPRLQSPQIGPTGTMTSQGWVRILPCGVEEYLRRKKLGEPPPTPWKRRLYLEWYSQNGRVTVEMGDVAVEECLRYPEDDDDEGEWAPLPNLALPPGLDGPGELGITAVQWDGSEAHTEEWTVRPAEGTAKQSPQSIPDELEQQFAAESAAIDRAIRGGEAGVSDEAMAETELMDACIEHSDRVPVIGLLGDLDQMPSPDDGDDDEVESALKVLLGQMALLGLALDVCKHYTPRESYRLLLDKILHGERAYEKLIGTGWVQHFMTHDYCAECEAEGEQEARAE